ncbi:unnamed protein product [Protopolystoma xenopodis]|uniref:Essential protein Yae1 N-terminal domain-containing protein n=1 Tax=Protopolystoma xenopodis TaxID=117903 RepID=A0A3S5BDR9_9PLAT|nr:unnamed protein product [Protopolystoma xenopodis]
MLDDVFDHASNDADDLFLGSREWDRRIYEANLSGQRDGLSDFNLSLAQASYKEGFALGWNATYEIAFLKGRLSALIHSTKSQISVYKIISELANVAREIEASIIQQDPLKYSRSLLELSEINRTSFKLLNEIKLSE